jgi:hypothetical protein
MGRTSTTTESVASRYTHFVYITGADGTGKSTQACLLTQHLRDCGVRCRHLWLRFPFFFSLPLLAYARWRGYSWHEVCDGVRHGYWDFRYSRWLYTLLPWVLLLDATLAAIGKVYVPLRLGKTIVCERFVLDMLVDLAVAFGDRSLHLRLPGKLYPRLVPRDAVICVLDLDAGTIRERRADLRGDRCLEDRLGMFRCLSESLSLPLLSSGMPVVELSQCIHQRMKVR